MRAVLEDAADALEADRGAFLSAGTALVHRMLTLGFVLPAD